MDFSLASLPPWLVPALILHIAQAIVLIPPAWRACRLTGAGAAWSAVLVLPVLGLILLAVVLGLRVLPRAGKSGAWAILTILPLANIVFLWLFAYARWSRAAAGERRTARREAAGREAAEGRTRDPLEARTRGRDQPARRAEPTLHPPLPASAAPANVAAADRTLAPEPPAAGPSGDAYESVDTGNRGFADQRDRAPEVGDMPSGPPQAVDPSSPEPSSPDETVIAGGEAPAASAGAEPGRDEVPRPEAEAEKDAPADRDRPAEDADGPTPDDMSLAAGVLSDLDAADGETPAPGQARPDPAPAKGGPLGDESRTVPVRRIAPRIWTLRGVNARSANIEVTVREADIEQSAVGILVGRSSRADFIISDESVSRNHARLIYRDSALCVEDLDSMNGTWVDGRQLDSNDPVSVSDQSEIEFGKIKLLVTEAPAA